MNAHIVATYGFVDPLRLAELEASLVVEPKHSEARYFMEISSSDQDIIDAIVGTVKNAEAGDPEVELRPHISQIVALSEVLVHNNSDLKAFVEHLNTTANANAINQWSSGSGTMASSPWSALADELKSLV